MQSFGTLLREHRVAAGLTQAMLCERAGIGTRGLQDLERGVSRPHRDTLRRLEEALALSPPAQAAFRRAATPSPRGRGTAASVARPRVSQSLTGERHNLPEQLSSFIGRAPESAEVIRLMARPNPVARLVTLTGTGGVGKTRLALHVAQALTDGEFPDGIWLIELAPLTEPSDISHAVATTLGLRDEPGQPLAKTLLDVIRHSQLLLVLDNCEHLVQACAELAREILATSPGVSILATSRERLGIWGETTLQVPRLECPEPTLVEPLDAFRRHEAVRLFAERAGIVVTPARAPAVARICARLEGIPLALELAAARARALSVDQIAARLDGSFDVLAAGDRTAPPRQQTLQATLAWSYDLLSKAEQRLFARLSLFAGAWTLEAAEDICAGDIIPVDRVLALLAQLIDKSLVAVEDRPGGSRWYRLLEPLREFASDRLRAHREEADLRTRHLAWYARMVEASDHAVRFTYGSAEDKVRRLIELGWDYENLRAAWHWSASGGGDVRAGLRLAAALLTYHFSYGYLSDGRTWLAALLERARDFEPGPERVRALGAAALLAANDLDDDMAYKYATECLALLLSMPDVSSEACAYNALGTVALRAGDLPNARALYSRSVALARLAGEISASLYLTQLGDVALREGELDEAQRQYEAAITDAHTTGALPAIGLGLNGLATVARLRGDAARAEALYNQGVRTLHDVGGLPHVVHLMLVALGYLALERSDLPHAATRFIDALTSSERFGHRLGVEASANGIAVMLLHHALALGETPDHAAQILRATNGAQPSEPPEPALTAASEQLDDLVRHARVLTLEEAVALARTSAQELALTC